MRRSLLSIPQILKWADAYHAREGQWPQGKCTDVIEGTGGRETWCNVDQALRVGLRGLPRGSSLARLLALHRGVRNRKGLAPLTIRKILLWADLHQGRTGAWPTSHSGPVEDAPGETWCAVEMALAHGQRGLPGGSSLARLLAERRQRPHRASQPPLTLAQVLSWADAHHARTGCWPISTSGPIPEAPGDTWHSIHNALRHGRRGLPGGLSLAQLLADQRGVRNRLALPPLTLRQVLLWADAHYRRTGRWPRSTSGPILCSGGETWAKVDNALKQGNRGLPAGQSLSHLLAEQRGVRQGSQRPPLAISQILRWADAHYARTGRWPHPRLRGPIPEAPGESWRAIHCALRAGWRGLPGGLTLHRVLVEHRQVDYARRDSNPQPMVPKAI
jgi:hypothetical protein